MDKLGIAVYLAIAFGVAYAFEAVIFTQELVTFQTRDSAGPPVFWGLYLIPGIAALLASVVSPKPPLPKGALWPIPWPQVTLALIATTLITFAVYAIELIAGVAEADWTLAALRADLPGASDLQLPAELPSAFFLMLALVINLVLATVLYGPLSLPAEYGWRGYLQPRLLPLGQVRAYILAGILWGLWFAPIAFSRPIGSLMPWSTFTRVLLMAIVFSILLGELYRRTNSLWPGAIVIGTFAAHASVFPVYLMDRVDAPWAGPIGYISAAVWLVAALIVYRPLADKSTQPSTNPQGEPS